MIKYFYNLPFIDVSTYHFEGLVNKKHISYFRKYAHDSGFVAFGCGLVQISLIIPLRITSQALVQSHDYPSTSETIPRNYMAK